MHFGRESTMTTGCVAKSNDPGLIPTYGQRRGDVKAWARSEHEVSTKPDGCGGRLYHVDECICIFSVRKKNMAQQRIVSVFRWIPEVYTGLQEGLKIQLVESDVLWARVS